MPTRPGQVPLQLATVRIGPRCVVRPGEDVMAVLPDGLAMKTSMPYFWLSMKLWPRALLKPWARLTRRPSFPMAAMSAASRACCAASQVWLAEMRRSPLATR